MNNNLSWLFSVGQASRIIAQQNTLNHGGFLTIIAYSTKVTDTFLSYR